MEELTNERRKQILEDAIKAGLRPARSKGFCIFCDVERECLSWVPERLNLSLPVCEKCFAKLAKAFGRVRGGLIWSEPEQTFADAVNLLFKEEKNEDC